MKSFIMLFLLVVHAYSSIESELFEKNWENPLIESRYCGRNSMNFIKWLHEAGVELEKTQIWQVTNQGFSYFGLVKYYQNRWSGFIPSNIDPNYLTNTSGGWHYHAFVVHQGNVYDFSYKEKPTIIPLKEYLHDMFTVRYDLGKENWLKRKYSLELVKKYQIIAVNGLDVIKAIKSDQKLSPYEMKLGVVADYMGLENRQLNFNMSTSIRPTWGTQLNKLVKKIPMGKLKFSRLNSCDSLFDKPNEMIIPE